MQKVTSVENAFSKELPTNLFWITTLDNDGNLHITVSSGIALISQNPWLVATAIRDHTSAHKNILEQKEFVISYPSKKMAEQTALFGDAGLSARKVTKREFSKLNLARGRSVITPILSDAVSNLECRLFQLWRPGDSTVCVGRVMEAHEHQSRAMQRMYGRTPQTIEVCDAQTGVCATFDTSSMPGGVLAPKPEAVAAPLRTAHSDTVIDNLRKMMAKSW